MTKVKRNHVLYHYSRFFGEPENMAQFHNPKVPDIVEFAPSSPKHGWVYATVGMSLVPLAYPSDWSQEKQERRIEIYIRSTKQNVELFGVLVEFANFIFAKKDLTNFGYLLQRSGGSPVVKHSSMTKTILLPPLVEPEKFAAFRVDDEVVRMVWAIPIHDSEAAFSQENGWEALVDLFYQNRPNTSEFMRTSVIS